MSKDSEKTTMATSEEIKNYIRNLAWERMYATPDRDFDWETEQRYGVSAWKDGYLLDPNGDAVDKNSLSVWDVLALSEL